MTQPPSGVITPTSGGTLTDSHGRIWSLTPAGAVDIGGSPVPGGSGTAEIRLINGTVYAEDAAKKVWYTWSGTTWVAATLPATGPTPASIGAAIDTVITTFTGLVTTLQALKAELASL
jgi:hypothetical protein